MLHISKNTCTTNSEFNQVQLYTNRPMQGLVVQPQVCLSADIIQERVTINSVNFDYMVAKTTEGIVVFTKS